MDEDYHPISCAPPPSISDVGLKLTFSLTLFRLSDPLGVLTQLASTSFYGTGRVSPTNYILMKKHLCTKPKGKKKKEEITTEKTICLYQGGISSLLGE
jgi:hypothetical protein